MSSEDTGCRVGRKKKARAQIRFMGVVKEDTHRAGVTEQRC